LIAAMRAITVVPMQANSVAVEDIDEPAGDGDVVAETIAIGICGTDGEILRGEYGWAPPGRTRLVVGHESLLRVAEAPAGSGFNTGDLAVGIVRRPDPVPCASCAAGEWDFCENGRYTERGIKERDGYGADRVRVEAAFLVKVDPALGVRGVLLEPASVVATAWRVTDAVGRRTTWRPRIALVTGAGPIGLLAALIGVQRGLDVHVLDRVTDGPKPALVKQLGATYHATSVHEAGPPPDIIMECTGVDAVVFAAMDRVRRNGVVCLTGVSSGAHVMSSVNIGKLNRDIVLENNIVVGSVNANRADYEAGARALAAADGRWLDGLITRQVPLAEWRDAFERRPGDVKTILRFAD
jgi:threonine dehydrogenase-like Zn-dependent dehydrogenase